MQTAISLVAAGFGIALLPACVQHLHRDGVVYRPLREPAPRTELAVVSRQDDPSPVLQNFLAIVRAQVRAARRCRLTRAPACAILSPMTS